MDRPLRELDVLALDCQTTGTTPAHGHLLEMAWCRARVGEGPPPVSVPEALDRDGLRLALQSTVVALPDGAEIPRRVRSLTGIGPDDLTDAPSPDEAWTRLLAAGHDTAIAVAHYARFEKPWLHQLHDARATDDAFPLQLVCTHDIARRLFPDLPRCGIRAVSGYLGQPLQELKRSSCHVEATVFIWNHLVDRLERDHQVTTLEALQQWLREHKPTRTRKPTFPLARDKRLALPGVPGVYRMLGRDGTVLYVGKATHLKRRVNSYFQKRREGSHKKFEMLVQVWDLDVTEVGSPLEAALLENDEIKRHAPPYNVALRAREREVVFATRDLDLADHPDDDHRIGPLPDAMCLQLARFLRDHLGRTALTLDDLAALGDSYLPTDADSNLDADGEPRDPLPLFTEALAMVRARHGLRADETAIERATLWRVGRDLHREWLLAREEARKAREAAAATAALADDALDAGTEAPEPDDEASPDDTPRRWVWTASALCSTLEDALRRTVQHTLTARWLTWLADATLVWHPKGRRSKKRHRAIQLHGGQVVTASDLDRDATPPDLPERARPHRARQRDIASVETWDRLRILNTELRRLLAEDRQPTLWFSATHRMDAEDLTRLLGEL